jgi:hypothetical protein
MHAHAISQREISYREALQFVDIDCEIAFAPSCRQ